TAVSGFGTIIPGRRSGKVALSNFAWMSQALDHAPLASNDVVTREPLPVRSRRYNPSMMAPNSEIAVGWSPIAGRGAAGEPSVPVTLIIKPARAQYANASYAGASASSPVSP